MTFLAARPFCSSQSRGCGCRATTRRLSAKMLSVRVAAAVVRALPRRAGLVSARNRWAGGGLVGGGVLIRELFLQGDRWWCADSGALSARRERGCSRRRHLALIGRRKSLFAFLLCGMMQSAAEETVTLMLPRDMASVGFLLLLGAAHGGALCEGQGLGARCRRPALKRRGSASLISPGFPR